MKTKIMLLITLFSVITLQAQVGIGTTAPNATLDVRSSNQATPTNTDGILIPKIDNFPTTNPTATQDGMLVYITGTSTPTKGFYYWNNTTSNWVAVTGVQRIDDLIDGKSDSDGTSDGSSIFLGVGAGANDDESNNRNVGVGFEALNSNTIGIENIAIGYRALNSNSSGYHNVGLGNAALLSNTTGADNIAIGDSALLTNTIGMQNIALGTRALNQNTTGTHNTGIGFLSLTSNTTGVGNVAIGHRTLDDNTIGTANVAIGSQALEDNISGVGNMGIGGTTFRNKTTGDWNIGIGYSSLYNNVSGSMNVGLGYRSGYNETGSNKLYIENSDANPDNALIYGDFGADNTATGNILRTNSEFQIGNPTLAGYAFPTTDGVANQVLQTDGNGALSWVDDTSIGVQRINDLIDGKSDNDGTNDGSSIFLGINAGASDDGSDNQNVGIGFESLNANISGNENLAIGYQALQNNTTGMSNMAIGNSSLLNNTTGSFNMAIGRNSLNNNTIGIGNKAFGTSSLASNTIGNYNLAFGGSSLISNTTGNTNSAFGVWALRNNFSGDNNVAFGVQGLNNNIIGSNNTAVGNDALFSSLGFGNVALGYQAGYNETGSGKLYIENSNADENNALIYGEFGSNNSNTGNILRTNSRFQIGNPTGTGYAFPTTDGTANQVLQTSGSGALTWVDVNSGTDNQNLTGATLTGTSLQIDIEDGTSTSVDLAGLQDGTGTDNQNLTAATLTGTTLQIDIENGTSASVDLSSLDNFGTDDQNLTAATLTGNTLQIDIENGSSASVDLSAFADADNLGNHIATADLDMATNNVIGVNYVSTRPVSSYDKLRVWNTGNFTIGLHSAMTYGFLNDYAMSFTMNQDTDRGWIWRDSNDAQNDGAMSLTTDGRLTLKSDLRIDTNTLSVNATTNRVGIGTISPSASLHVNHPNGSATHGIVISNQTDVDEWRIYQQWSSNTLALFFNNVNVGNFDDVSGTYTPVSDRRLKKNITSFNTVLDDVKKLNVVNYQFNHQLSNRNYVGLLAQEVQTVFPHLVYQNAPEEDDQLTMDYSGFGVLAIKAIQEQQQIIDKQQEEITELKKEIQLIKKILTENKK